MEHRAPLDDPRLDTSAWRVFGRRLPRRWSLYFRVVAALLLLGSLGWWFTRDVTYIGNVKASGLDAVAAGYRAPLRELGQDFATLVNRLTEKGYAWQAGALPALRTADALAKEERRLYLALAMLEVKKGGDSLADSPTARECAGTLAAQGWRVPEGTRGLDGVETTVGPLRGVLTVETRPEGRERLLLKITLAGP
ncbi:MAG: hypothetical protein M5U22_11765 [Thermoleophilia bacterium]|nr:hypothetical protein [Thermoleophilia bacterium]